jgi:trans-aconitate methyltransferase
MKWNTQLYNNKHAFVYQYGEAVIELLNPRPYEKILDLGCGTGELTQKIKEAGSLIIGIDSSVEMIEKARKEHPLISFEVMDAVDMNYKDEFDAVFSNAVLHWIKEKERVVEKVFQSLRTGGRFVAEFGGKNNVINIVNALGSAFRKRNLPFEKFWYFPSTAEYAGLLEEKGFRVSMIQHFDRPTELADNTSGIKEWIEMFGSNFFKAVPGEIKKEIIEEAIDTLRETNYQNGKWYADYTRLKFVALKQ